MPGQVRSACFSGNPEVRTTAGASSVNGMAVSPHGNLKILVVFAGYTEETNIGCTTASDPSWPTVDLNTGVLTPGSIPPLANLNPLFYQTNTQFSPGATDQTISNYLYQMSLTSANPFKVTFGWLPTRANVSYAAYPDIFAATQAVVQQAVNQAPANFNWSSYDQHTNHPNFATDNSSTGPDGILDYVVVIWRTYGYCVPPTQTTAGIPGGLGGGHGAAGYPTGNVSVPANGSHGTYRFAEGHLQTNALDPNLFMHEFAHNLYNPPHMLAADGVTGNRFFMNDGWGMMCDIPTMFSANAWERWHLGWMELQASNGQYYYIINEDGTRTGTAVRVNSDVQDASSLTATNGYYTLRDFTTTGDVVRVKIPNATNQYLWLENRAKNGPFDRRNDLTWGNGSGGFLQPSKGLLAMVESLADRTPITNNNDAARENQLRTLSAEGNFDYVAAGPASPPATYNYHLYQNYLFNFTTPAANASGGANQITRIRLDKNGDNVINYDPRSGNDYGAGGLNNESTWQVIRNGQANDGTFGPNIGTRTVGFRYGLESNPLLIPNQTVIGSGTTVTGLSEIPLNGLSVEITAYNSSTGDLTIRVRYDNVTVNKDTRWTGQLRTYPVANASPGGTAIFVNSGKRLTLDRSGTPQRSTRSSQGDFVNDTKLSIMPGAALTLASCANVDLKGTGTQLYVENGGFVSISGCATLTAYAGTSISVNNSADISGSVALKVGSSLFIRSTGQTIAGTL